MAIPSLETARQLAQSHTILPLAKEIFSDVRTPIAILRQIQQQSSQFFMLESVTRQDSWGRYSFLGYAPALTIKGRGNTVTLQAGGETTIRENADPMQEIRSILARHKSPQLAELPPFTGGLVGYFAYDFVRHTIPGLHLQAENKEAVDDFHLMLMDKVIAFDHFKQKIFLIVNIPAENLEQSYAQGLSELESLEKLIYRETAIDKLEIPECGAFTPRFSEAEYCRMVQKAKHYIREGDIFQVVPSNCFSAPFKGSLLPTYRVLRTVNPSPYMVYLQLGEVEIACASPETLVSLRDGTVSTFPLAGTCPRGKDESQDQALIQALLSDPKELAEHDMLVDLGRNDLGKVSRFGSVAVKEYRQIKKFSHVSHIASRVTGTIREDKDALDAIAATLPAGTLSGAPKKRACEIIDELEGTARGVYGGAMGYIDFTGNMDMCIGIRMAVHKNGKVFVQAGGGVVFDSDPQKEYQETLHKSKAVMKALQYREDEIL